MENIYKEKTPLYVAQELFPYLDRQCKNSKFILNTRNKQNWLKSRILHENGEYLNYVANKLSISKDDVVKEWERDWDSHHISVIDYFRDRPNDLLIFDIETDPIEKLIYFLKGYLKLDRKYYIHRGKSTNNFNIGMLDYETRDLYNKYTVTIPKIV